MPALSKPAPEEQTRPARDRARDRRADELLIAGLKAGEKTAQERLEAALRRLAAGAARRFRLSKEDEEDVVQEVLLKLFAENSQKLQNFAFRCRLEEWMGVIVLNHVRDSRRYARRQEAIEQGEQRFARDYESVPESEALIEQLAAEADVSYALEGLEPDLVQLLRLRYQRGLPWRTVALLTGLSEQAATSRVYRALGLMQERLNARDQTVAGSEEP